MKKVSIITPVYNTKKYLKGTIESVLNQTYENIEFIIINDGSTDGSDKVIESFKDKRIKYINQKNMGIGKARNNGLKIMTGDYVCFLDSDDQMEKNAIEVMVKKFEKNKCDMLITNYTEYFEPTKETNKVEFEKLEGGLFDHPDFINKITLGPNHKLFKSELFNKYKFPEGVKYEDFALMLKVMTISKKIITIDDFLFRDTKRSQSETLVIDKRVYDIFVSLDDVIDFYKSYKYPNKEIRNQIFDELDYFITKMCILYATKSKHQKDKDVKYKFIDDAYSYLKEMVPDYKNNRYFKDCSLIKRIIQKNKWLLKIYCSL